MKLRVSLAIILAVGVGAGGIGLGLKWTKDPAGNRRHPERLQDFAPIAQTGLIRPILEVPAVPAALLAPGRIADEESVVGVVLGGEARAYPVATVRGIDREVLNDRLGGRAILMTWCNLCQTARVFLREFDGAELRFASSGMIWHENMVLRDLETGSLWSQLYGEAMEGSLAGVRLEALATVLTDWKSWKEEYPETTILVLDREGEPMPQRLRYPPESGDAFVLGVASDDAARGWTLDRLRDHPVINDAFDGRPVLVVFDPGSATAALFDRAPGGRVLSFRRRGGDLVDDQTGSTWDPITGQAQAGPMEGHCLEPIPAALAWRRKWLTFYPDTRLWQAAAVGNRDDATDQATGDNAD